MRTKLLAVAALVLAAGVARADIDKATARAVLEKTKKAVVTARVVLKISINGREREQKLEVTGTVIDPSGLTVVPAASIDPAESLRGGMGGGRRGGGGAGGGGADMKIESDVTETTLVLDDGTEVEADVVLKDADLDLAFIRPRDAKTKTDAVELKAHEAAPQELDEIFVIGRLSRVANHAPAVSKGFIRGVVKGPRPFYVADELLSVNTGCVVWDDKGAPLGLLVHKTKAGEGRGSTIVVIRPIAEVIELAAQAKTAKAPEKKKAEEPKKSEDGKKDEDGKKADGKKPAEDGKSDGKSDGKKKEEDDK
jgi:hypothetical protein